MEYQANAILTIGALLLLGIVTNAIGQRTPIPRVTLLLIFGFIIGPSGFNLLPLFCAEIFPLVAKMALLMVGFILGERMSLIYLHTAARQILIISMTEVIVTAGIVLTGLYLAGVNINMALLLAAISTATAPAATVDVIHEKNASGKFTHALEGIVAIDDAWGLMVFSIMMAIVLSIIGSEGISSVFIHGFIEIGGAFLLGILLGAPMSYLTGRIKPGEPTLIEALGFVFLCGGLAIVLNVSYLLAAMTMGAVVVNFAKHHTRPFNAIKHIETPFMILFFILAGASFKIDALDAVWLTVIVYILMRITGRLIGGWIGAALSGGDRIMKNWIGMALMPQAGVALGMALVASHRFPEIGKTLLPIIIGTTVFFELTGPIMTRMALVKAGDIPDNK
ncbi:MAG: cation:proton antiporter [Nitrospira sp.]|nr:cation:proton antiporter [bacterium]MBL7050044.1 cation:proton antiporter [Nitrospira sp.]